MEEEIALVEFILSLLEKSIESIETMYIKYLGAFKPKKPLSKDEFINFLKKLENMEILELTERKGGIYPRLKMKFNDAVDKFLQDKMKK